MKKTDIAGGPAKRIGFPAKTTNEGLLALEILLVSIIERHPKPGCKNDEGDLTKRLSKAMEQITGRKSQSVALRDLEVAANATAASGDNLRANLIEALGTKAGSFKRALGDSDHKDIRRLRRLLKGPLAHLPVESNISPDLWGAITKLSSAINDGRKR